jgi:hypothetical protein
MTKNTSRLFLIGTSVSALLALHTAALAKPRCVQLDKCDAVLVGKRLDNSTVEKTDLGANTETTVPPDINAPLFSVSVDGEHVAGTTIPKDLQRKVDLALEATDIQVKFDGLDVKPILNVSTYPPRESYQPGEQINFLASSNYPAWISKSEIRIFKTGDEKTSNPLYVIPATPEGAASWTLPKNVPTNLVYVLRVTDQEGRFDETVPLQLTKRTKALPQAAPQDGAVAPGYSEDRTAVRNIPVYGGAVTVYGRNVPNGAKVAALGEVVPVDESNAFVMQRILPPGDHAVKVSVTGEKSKGFAFERAIFIPENDWFYVGQVDATVGKNFGTNNIVAVNPGEFKNIYTKGRIAFYVKGKIKGRYLLTAAADTGEDKIQNLFKGLDAKDPKQFLRRIAPNDYYPVYGDDSTTLEDAPTRGKFYVRLAKGESHVQWGNFKTEIKGTEFLRNERALYGASGVYKSEDVTSFGERKTQAAAYVAQPGTLPQRDEFRGTGGSAYVLKHQDITIGSDTVFIEVRDHITGRVLSRQRLVYGQDYDFDFVQGIIILRKALPSTSSDTSIIRDNSLNGIDNYLVSSYEFTPVASDVNGYVYGGRVQQWLGEHVRIGVTGQNEKTGGADQKLVGADLQIRKSERTFIEGEIANSDGPGFGYSSSADGGLTQSTIATAGLANKNANAYRLHGKVGLDEVTDNAIKGDLDGYFDQSEAGFSSLGKQTPFAETNAGVSAKVDLSDRNSVSGSFNQHKSDDGTNKVTLNAQSEIALSDKWKFAPGIGFSKTQTAAATNDGARTDVGAKLTYDINEQQNVYVFGQATVDRSGSRRNNNRIGVGGKTDVSEKTDLSVEISAGNSGLGAAAKLDYHPTVADHYYLGYTLDPDREYAGSFPSALQGTDLGAIVAGATHSYSERLTAFAEDSSDLFGRRRSLTQTYGVKYTPDSMWTVGGNFELGTIWDDTINDITHLKNSDFDRKAVSGTVGYRDGDAMDGHLKGELRYERSDDHTRDMNSYLLQTGFNIKAWDDWRLSANLDAVISDASASIRSGKYVEGSIGYAYRPTENDRLNALFKYTFLYDLPGADQVAIGGNLNGPQQLSHILSADFNYDLTKILTIGGKYGFRIGETKDRAAGSTWLENSAHLGEIRFDLHVVKNWDALAEARVLWSPESESADYGALVAVYRHLSDNFKIGVGYNFGHFSDDLRSINSDSHGIFINAIGKF